MVGAAADEPSSRDRASCCGRWTKAHSGERLLCIDYIKQTEVEAMVRDIFENADRLNDPTGSSGATGNHNP